jgi:hypothetical protein
MRVVTLLFCALLWSAAHAECQYSNYELTLKLTRTNGEQLVCFRTMSACNIDVDRLGDTAYLMEVLYNTAITADVRWYRHRAAYRYCVTDEATCTVEEQSQQYVFFDGITVDRADVRRIDAIAHERVSAFDHVSSQLQMTDTVLFHREPVEVISCSGYLCYHRIAVYRRNAKLASTFAAIDALNAEIAAQPDDLDHTNGDVLDARMEHLVVPLLKEKGLVIVSGCTD